MAPPTPTMTFAQLPLPELSKISDNPDATPIELKEVLRRFETFANDGSPLVTVLRGCTGMNLQVYKWNNHGPQKGVVVLVHGLYSHARHGWFKWVAKNEKVAGDSLCLNPVMKLKLEGSWVDMLLRKGYTVIAYDQQGFGLSEGWQGHRGSVEQFDHYAKDAQLVLSHARKCVCESPATPITFIGSSLGGAVCLRMLQLKHSIPVDSVVLLAPMLMIPGTPPTWLASPALSVAKAFHPHGFMSPRQPQDTRDLEAAFVSDPLTFKGGLRYSMAKACFNGAQLTLEGADGVTSANVQSVLAIHSEIDQVIDVRGSQLLLTRLDASVASRSRLVVLSKEQGFNHSLSMEYPGAVAIMQIVLDHLDKNGNVKNRRR
eukprot:GHVN01003919.1.p1 GENE.GHVN01003919.1~~GHVN01003919.1.p1  ORF type:complete len:373 (-),score=47.98 GHVN01003919.1:320-1438(-)